MQAEEDEDNAEAAAEERRLRRADHKVREAEEIAEEVYTTPPTSTIERTQSQNLDRGG